MGKRTVETTPPKETLAERKERLDQVRMSARLRESERLAQVYFATLDPRQRAGGGGDPHGEKVCSE